MKHQVPITACKRGPQIIKLLNTHGPLNTRAICGLIEPPIARRRLTDVLARLMRRGIVVRRFHNLFTKCHDQYYQLSARKEHQTEIGDVIGMDPNIFRMPKLRNQDVFHSMGCAYLAESLRKNFPGADVVREFHLLDHRAGEVTLLKSLSDGSQIIPDMMLSIPGDENHREVNIVFEFERSRKAPERIAEKFRRYARGTRIDGVVWMCEERWIQKDLSKIWLRQDRDRLISVRERFDHYLLFSTNEKVFQPDDLMFNASGEAIRLNHWINVLRSKANHPVKDEHFRATSHEPAQLG